MNVYIHDKNSLKTYIIKYIICLLPLYIYGFYKNGILLYINDYTNIFSMFKIFYLVILSIIAYFITNKILKKVFKIDLIFLSLFLIPLFCPVKINLLFYFSILFIFLLFRKFYNVALVILVLSLFTTFITGIDNSNLYAFNLWDKIWGRNIGGIGSTSICLGLISFIVLSFINNHKFLVSLSSLCSFILLSIIFQEYSLLLNGNSILSILFIVSLPDKSPILKKNMIYYGFFVGVLGFIFCLFVNSYYGMILSIAIMSIFYEYIIFKKKDLCIE